MEPCEQGDGDDIRNFPNDAYFVYFEKQLELEASPSYTAKHLYLITTATTASIVLSTDCCTHKNAYMCRSTLWLFLLSCLISSVPTQHDQSDQIPSFPITSVLPENWLKLPSENTFKYGFI